MSIYVLPVETHQSHLTRSLQSAMTFLADPKADAREHCPESIYPWSLGVATAVIGDLLDVLGHPEHGPNVGQWSWLPDDEDDEDDEVSA